MAPTLARCRRFWKGQTARPTIYDPHEMLFAMIRKGGPAWDPARPLREQDAWAEHAAFMDALADEGFLVLAGSARDGLARAVERAAR